MTNLAFPFVPFFQAINDCTGGNYKVQRKEYESEGELPVIDQGQDFVAGYTAAVNQYRGRLPLVLFGDHTRIFKYVDFPFALGADGVKALEPIDGFDAKFLYYYLRSISIPNAGYSRHFKFLKEVQIPKLPLPEQRRIVDLLSRAEGIVRLRREAEKKASELIPALFLDIFGDPATNPKGWTVAKVGALLLEPPTLGTMAKPSNTVGQWLDLRVANIQGGQLTLADKKWLDLPDSQVSRFALRSGDVVLARAIGSLDHLGKAVVLHPDGDWTFDSHLMRLRFDNAKLLPQVFKAFLESTSGREAFLKHTRRSAVQFNINGKEIRQIEIAVPPMALQQGFWERTEQVHSIQSQQSTATAKAQATFDALLARCFAPTAAIEGGSSD